MIGIKGVGMTMLAQFLAEKGIEVSGSDTAEKFMTDEILNKAGIKVIENFSEDNIPRDADLIIFSTAYNAERNVEVKKSQDGKIKTLTYAEALGEIFNSSYGVAVIGSHGKTTTTAWLGYVLEKSEKNPSVMVGSNVPQFEGASLVGKSDILVIEADEYQNKLKYFNPKGVLLNNVDYDHPDFFPTEDDYENAFIEFIKKIPKKGFLVANFDDEKIRKFAGVNTKGKVVSYAINNNKAEYVAYDLRNENGMQYFKVKINNEKIPLAPARNANDAGGPFIKGEEELGEFAVSLFGIHNIYNALAVICACIELDVELTDIRTHLSEFKGTARRAEIMGNYNGALIIDDYAHHPTEIKTTINGIKQNYKNHKLIVVFHPHTFTRTKALLDDFAQSFSEADELIVLDIYGSAREEQGGVSSLDLINKIESQYQKDIKSIRHIPTLDECEKYLRERLNRNDVVLLMGAGDVFRVGKNLITK